MDLFDACTFGPQRGDRQLSAWRREWHRHTRWLCRYHRAAQIVIVVGELAVAYLAFVFGLLFGAGLHG
jgi:hypothetical protein